MSPLPPSRPNPKTSVFAPASKDAGGPLPLSVTALEDRVVPAGQVVGSVFLDFNANGLFDAAGTLPNDGSGTTPLSAEGGVGGVVVTAYDAANAAQGSATTAVNGSYTLNTTGSGPYRLEFTNLPAGLFAGPQGSGAAAVQSGTTVQFVPDGNSADVNVSLVRPTDITADNPLLISQRYHVGDRTGGAATFGSIQSFPYSAGAEAAETDVSNTTPYADPLTHQIDVTHGQVGATWGLAFDAVSDKVYAAAFTKRHSGYGPNGPGAIYRVDMPSAATPVVTTASLFVDLNALTGNAAAGADFRSGGGGGYDYITDQDDVAWDAVGKTGLGGLVVDSAGDFMYTVGLADRRLYRIRIPADGSSPTAANVTSFAIPLPTGAGGVTGITGGTPLGDLRPFAVEIHNGIVYVGAVNSAESTGSAADLRAFVFAFDPTAASGAGAFVNLGGATTATEAVFTAQLDYDRGHVHPGDTNPPTAGTVIPAEWNPWVAVRTTLADTAAGERYGIYPQPELTGLAFDTNGNITLGLRDRAGDQFGNFLTFDFPGTPNPGTKGITAGDTLRANIVTPGDPSSGWTFESNGGGTAGAGNGQGPGGGEFYFQDDLPPGIYPLSGVDDHHEVSAGGVLQLPGRDLVAVTAFDPIRVAGQYDAGGVRWFDTSDGTLNKAYRLFDNSPTTFAKSNGIGDLIAATRIGREIGNRVWSDDNANGRQDPGEAGIQSVVVVLVSVTGGVATPLATATTDAAGNYYFSSSNGASTSAKQFGVAQLAVTPPVGTSYEVRLAVSDPALANLSLSPFQAVGANALNNSDGVVTGTDYAIQNVGTQPIGTAQHTNDIGFRVASAQLSGFVYEDNDRSSSRNAGDAAIGGATVVLTGVLTAGGATITPLTTTTDGTGFYQFTDLLPGTYQVNETQPAGFLDFNDQIGSTGGTAGNDVLSAIPIVPNDNSINNNFGEVRPVQLSGFVYHDINDDGDRDAGTDAAIAGVTVVLTGVDDLGTTIAPVTSTTDANGFYSFAALRPGDYTVSETQPANFTTRTNNPGTTFAPGTGTAGTVVGDTIQNVVLNSNANSPDNNFGEILTANAQLSGFVYEDNDRSSTRNGPDAAIAGTTVVLTGGLTTGGTATPRTTTTDGTGFYSFTGLLPGIYTVTETQPAGFLDFNDQIGSTGGTAGNDVLSAIPLVSGANSTGNNFGEVRPVQLSGFVYEDVNDDGDRDAGTDAAIAGVTVVLTGVDDLGTTIAPVASTTDANGFYSFAALRPGDYTVSETQPANFTTRTNNPGTTFAPGTGTAGTVVGDAIQTIRLNSNANSPDNNFGEIRTANAQLSGFVYEDVNGTNARDAGDFPIAGTTVVLTGTLTAGGTITPRTTTTDGTGFYQFTALPPGSYTVTETQPAGYLDSGDQIGSTGGTVGNDVLSVIPLVSGANSVNNNFGEVRGARVSGYVYHDIDDNGAPNAGDASLPGVTVVLTGATDQGTTVTPRTTTTDGSGAYEFAGLRPGTYTVAETQPAGYLNRTNTAGPVTNGTPGTVNGDTIQTIVLLSNGDSPNNNFGEIVPVPPLAQVSGYVYRDPNLNGLREPGNGNERGLGGVTVRLFREDAPGVLTPVGQAQTDGTGFYSFDNLSPGTYRVVETQPVGFYSTRDAAGTTGGNAPGNDTITTIPLAAGQDSRENNFGEIPRTNLFGYVWVDGDRDGIFDPGEAPIPGAVVNISGTAFSNTTIAQPLNATLARGPLTAITDANGRYDFLTLPPGVYNLVQTNTPAGLQDFRSQNASGQAVQSSTATTFGGVSAQAPAQGPLNFGKVSDGNNDPREPSKRNFLGSSVLTSTASANPLVGPSTVPVNTTPAFAVGTGDPAVPAPVVIAAGAGFSPIVRVFDYASGVETFRFQAFEASMTAGVRATTGDVTGDGVPDVIAVPGPGAGPRVRVFDGTDGTLTRDFFAYPPEFRGGLYVATGDFNGDGRDDIVTGAGEGGGPNVRVFDGATGALITSFFAFDSAQRGGARVAVGDFNGDGRADIAASNGPGNTSLVRVFNGVGFGQLSQFTPYTAAYTGGVFLAAGDLDGDGRDELVTGADQGGGPNVRTFNALTGQLRNSFFAYESTFTGGVRVTARDLTGDGIADIIAGAGIGGASRIRVFSGATLQPVEEFYAFDSGVRTGIFLG